VLTKFGGTTMTKQKVVDEAHNSWGEIWSLRFFFLTLHEKSIFISFKTIHCTMAENANKQGQQLKIELKPEVASGEYSNLVMINHSSSEFVLDFVHMLPIAPPQVFSRVIMAPEHAKRLLGALQENIARYEAEFGPIRIPQPKAPEGGRTIAPFNTGEA
jgi:hypothetical protein